MTDPNDVNPSGADSDGSQAKDKDSSLPEKQASSSGAQREAQPSLPQVTLPPKVDSIVADEALRTRIQQLVEQPKHPFLRHPLTSVVVGFVLSGIIGSYLADRIQKRNEANKRIEDIRELRRTTAVSVFESVISLLSRGAGFYDETDYQMLLFRASFSPDPSFINEYGTNVKPVQNEAERSFKKATDFNSELSEREIIDNAKVCASFGEKIADRHAQVVQDIHAAYFHLEQLHDKGRAHDAR